MTKRNDATNVFHEPDGRSGPFWSISRPFQTSQPADIQLTGSTRSPSNLSLSRHPDSSSLKLCNRCLVHAAPDFWNELPKDIPQFAHTRIPPLNFTAPTFELSSATFHSLGLLKTELFKLAILSYP